MAAFSLQDEKIDIQVIFRNKSGAFQLATGPSGFGKTDGLDRKWNSEQMVINY